MAAGECCDFRPEVRIFLLGGFAAECNGKRIPESAWGRPQARTLIKLLATERNHRLHREQVLDLLWPDAGIHSAGVNLRRLLYLARQVLGQDTLISHNDLIMLASEHVWIDADAFESTARHALAGGGVEELERAEELYRGDLLPEDRFAPWAEQSREELVTLRREVLLAASSVLAAEGREDEAVSRLRAVLAIDQADEVAHRALMRLHAQLGDRPAAFRQYQLCVHALKEHLGVQPSAETEALYREIAAGSLDRRAPSPLPSAARRASRNPLVGRYRALSLIQADWSVARAGKGQDRRAIVTIGGEAGAGKTRLAAEAARLAESQGATVLWGSASELAGRVAYGVFAEALEECIASLSTEERKEIASSQPELGRIIPSLEVTGPPGGDPQSEQMRLFAAVARLLARIAGDRMLLLIIDDLHLVDDASLQLLRYLVRLASDRRWRMIGTYREERVRDESPLGTLIAELLRMGVGLHVDLLPLARRECDQLVEGWLAPQRVALEVLDHVFAFSLGNPLFALELVASLREAGRLVARDATWLLEALPAESDLPRGVTTLIESRLHSLGEEGARLLAVAAVGGMVCDPELVIAASGQDEDTVTDVLDRAVSARILEEREHDLTFRHPLFREVLYQGLSTRRRAQLHAALGQALEARRPADLDILAYHFGHSHDDEKAILYLERAGDQARDIFANQIAEARYSELCIRLASLDRPAELARGQEKLGSLLLTMARLEEAAEALKVAAEQYRRVHDLAGLGRVAARVATIHAHRGAAEEGLRYVEEVLAEIGGQVDGVVVGQVHLSKALLCFASGRYQEQLEACTRAVEVIGSATGIEQNVALARAYMVRGIGLIGLNRIRAGGDALQEALATFPESGDLELLGLIHYNLSWVSVLQGELAAHLAHTDACLEVIRKIGRPAVIALATARLGLAYFMVGDWPQARALMDQAIVDVRRIEAPFHTAFALTYRGILARATGELVEARGLLQEALGSLHSTGDPVATALAASYLFEVDMAEGRPDEALSRMEPLFVGPERLAQDNVEGSRLLGRTAWALAELGVIERAETLSVAAVERAAPQEVPFLRVDALGYRALVLAVQQRWQEAEQALQEALDLSREVGFAWFEAWILECWTRLEMRRGRLERARERARAGAAILRLHAAEDAATSLLALAGTRQRTTLRS